MDGISIIICCYNSEKTIKRTLEHIIKQELPINISWEVIIVDNNCSDKTVLIANELLYNSSVSYKIVKEDKAGLVYARLKGVESSQYDFILFCDDDNLLCKTYAVQAYEILKNDESIGACGGKGIPEFEIQPTKEIVLMKGCYALGSQIKNKLYLYGAGICLRKKLYENLIKYKIPLKLTGRKGNLLLAGDDSEICKWILLMGYKLQPSDSLIFTHIIQKKRLNNTYLKSIIKGITFSEPILATYNCIILKEKSVQYYKHLFMYICLLLKSVLQSSFNLHKSIYIYYYFYCIKAYLYWGKRELQTLYNDTKNIIESKELYSHN